MQTQILTGDSLAVKRWSDKVFLEYLDRLVLKQFMGTDENACIQVTEDLAKDKGDAITFPLLMALASEGVQDEAVMEGNEEALQFFPFQITMHQYKNAVRLAGSLTRRRTAFEIKDQARPALTTWLSQKVERMIFDDFHSVNGVLYSAATSAQLNAFLAANTDRFLFGSATANLNSSSYSSSLATIDSTNDILTTNQISLAKRMAQLASPKVRPIKLENGEEWFVMFVHPYAARDLKNTTAWQEAQKLGQPRGSDNPIFTGALGTWDGVILKETPKCPLLAGVGTGSINVVGGFLCGAQAHCIGHGGYDGGEKIVITEKEFDYGEQWGAQIKTLLAHGKAIFNGKQNGVVTVYSSGLPD